MDKLYKEFLKYKKKLDEGGNDKNNQHPVSPEHERYLKHLEDIKENATDPKKNRNNRVKQLKFHESDPRGWAIQRNQTTPSKDEKNWEHESNPEYWAFLRERAKGIPQDSTKQTSYYDSDPRYWAYLRQGKTDPGYVYIFKDTNSKQQLLKIGKTSRTVEARLKELNQQTGVSGKFEKVFSVRVCRHTDCENEIHRHLRGLGKWSKKEFFHIDIETAIKLTNEIAKKYGIISD